jgi:hypothetical protein
MLTKLLRGVFSLRVAMMPRSTSTFCRRYSIFGLMQALNYRNVRRFNHRTKQSGQSHCRTLPTKRYWHNRPFVTDNSSSSKTAPIGQRTSKHSSINCALWQQPIDKNYSPNLSQIQAHCCTSYAYFNILELGRWSSQQETCHLVDFDNTDTITANHYSTTIRHQELEW